LSDPDDPRGSERNRPVLVLHRGEGTRKGKASLQLRDADGNGCEIRLPPRLARLLRVLAKAEPGDRDASEESPGYHSAEKIAELMTEQLGRPIFAETVVHYVLLIRKHIRAAARRWPHAARYASTTRGLIQTAPRPRRGYRLDPAGVDIVVKDPSSLREREASPDAASNDERSASRSVTHPLPSRSEALPRGESAINDSSARADRTQAAGDTHLAFGATDTAPAAARDRPERNVTTHPHRTAADAEGTQVSGGVHDHAATDWRLLVEPLDSAAARDASELAQIELSGELAILDVDALRADPASALVSSPQGSGLELEPVRMEGRDVLLLAVAPDAAERSRVRVNGLPAPRLSVLDLADEVLVDATTLHVTRYHSAQVGPPPPELIGEECQVCRVVIKESSQVLVHPPCGRPLHHEPEGTPESKPRLCTSYPSCPHCLKSIRLVSEFAYLPVLS
jgi:hypothetical protein